MPEYRTADHATLTTGDRAYDYYTMKAGHIGEDASIQDGWFDFHHDDGTRVLLNGDRICTLLTAARRGHPGAIEALAVELDPDDTLTNIRGYAGRKPVFADEPDRSPLAINVMLLDHHLSRGGTPPTAWTENADPNGPPDPTLDAIAQLASEARTMLDDPMAYEFESRDDGEVAVIEKLDAIIAAAERRTTS